MNLLVVCFLIFSQPRYYIFDPLNKGIERLDVKILKRISQNLYLVEGKLEEKDLHFYEIAPYMEQKEPKFELYGLPDLRYNPIIDSFVQKVNVDSIYSFLYRMEAFQTRYSYADSCRSAEIWAYNKFLSWGYDVEFFPYEVAGDTWRNVIATKWGADSNDIFCIIAHLDCTSNNPYVLAPGADDNGSGSAMVLEAARVLKNFNTSHTLRFILFTGEEQGLVGSSFYAGYADSINMPLRALINFDMVSYTDDSNIDLEISTNQPFSWLVDFQKAMADTYTTLITHIYYNAGPGSDHWPFLMRGFPASFSIEYAGSHWYPYYHTTGDTVGNLNPLLLQETAKMGVASMTGFGIYPVPPKGIRILDPGTGDSLVIKWLPNPEPDITGYVIYMGTQSGNYTDTFMLGNVTQKGIGNLIEGTTYYFRLRAVGTYGIGFPSPEFTGTPLSVPRKPFVIVNPDSASIFIGWRNYELDIMGYNLYKAVYPDSNFQQILNLTADTAYFDFNVTSGVRYWYYVEAVDSDMNYSPPSETLSAVPVTLDMGILLVDETRNGNGNPGFPTDEQVDEFYDTLLSGISYSSADYDSLGYLDLSIFAPYEIIIVHADDFLGPKAYEYVNDVFRYMGFGGKLIFSGWQPIDGMVNGNYPYNFSSGNPFYDVFGIEKCINKSQPDFVQGIGLFDYPYLHVNPDKITPGAEGKLYRVEAYNLANSLPIYLFDSYENDPLFEGKPCGLKDSNFVLLGFPLYFINTQDAKLFMQKALFDLGYIQVQEKEKISVNRFFIPAISRKPYIEFDLPYKEKLSIKVFDASGRKIFSKESVFSKGEHRVELNIKTKGVYFVKIQSSKIMRLIKFIKI
jgi:hypothetical protein